MDILTLRSGTKKISVKLLCLALLLVGSASANKSITMKGKWTPICNGVEVSQHNRYDKALEVVINQNYDCDIIPPDRFEYRSGTIEPAQLVTIAISWDKPTELEDGTALKTIDRFNIYYDFNGVFQDVIEVEADSVMYTLADVAAGSYSFQISTVSNGVEGKKSDAVIIQAIE